MAEIDPVILQLRADVNQYLTTLRKTTADVDRLLGAQEKRQRQLESEMRRSSGAIANELRGLAAAFAGAFTGREVMGLVDNFTRLQNSLRVAGLEGQALAMVQRDLLAIGSRYGVSINELAGLYGNSSQAAKELGASQGQLLQLTESTAQALLITGTSSAQAQGAILGLTQALASGTVRAEEFNQINEGGLRPLLQAAAAAGRWGGSVAKLRQDVLDGKVSSQEFFAAIMAGSKALEGQASKAVLTISGAFTSLSNALTVYVGEAAQANGATAAIAMGLQSLAENLDLVINALAVIGTVLAGRFVAGALAGGVAMRTLSAYASIATTSLAGTALAARGAGVALLGAFGGPIGLAVTALALGLGYLATRTEEVDAAAQAKARTDMRAAAAAESHAAATEQLTRASEKERAALLASMQASRARAAQALQTAKAQLVEARAAIAVARANAQKEITTSTRSTRGAGGGIDPTMTAIGRADATIGPAEARLKKAEDLYAKAEGQLEGLDRAIAEASKPVRLPPATGKTGKKSGGSSGSGMSAAERQARFDDEMRRLDQEELRAKLDLADTAEERADLEKDVLAAERASRIAAIEADKDFTRAQKDAQIAAIDRIYGRPAVVDPKTGEMKLEAKPGLAAQRVNRDLERKQNDLAINQLEAQAATLDAQIDLETNTKKRNALERKSLDLHQKIERARLEEAIAAGQIAASTRQELAAQQAIERRKMERAQRTPGQVYADDLREAADNINDAIESIQVKGLQSLNDGIVEAIMGTKSLGDVFKNVANQIISDLLRIAVQRAIIEPLANALFGGGNGGSSIGKGIASIFGRASGGYVAPGQMVRVNEGASPGRVEAFMSRDGGKIIPLGQMNALQAAGGTGGVATVRVELAGDIDGRIQAISGNVAVEVVRASAPSIIDASARETMARAGRPRM